ncbi:energy transducer TonB [Bacteroides intestinalis]|jgi:TonB family protein|uniref:energy transducer TonB n=1 Tax=Bacteroides intestinalis TaxID=329854 RepID=UPI00189E0EBF|nr:energy transducer TonB [Bacteroides intestinalis]
MKTKTLVGILLCFLMGCVNKTHKTTVADKADSATNITILDEKAYEAAVDQSAGWEIIKNLSKIYGEDPNVIGDFIGAPRCPAFLEGLFFEGSTLYFQVRGDTLQARHILEKAAGSRAFRLEEITEGNYSQQQLNNILDELNRRYDALTDKNLKSNMISWGMGLRYIEVRFILNTPEARQAFRKKLMDSPAIRFEGPERPRPNGRIGVTDTFGISLRPEYSVYSNSASTASFVLLNQGDKEVMCGEHYSVTFEDEDGTWRELPINDTAVDIGYIICPGGHRQFTARLYPHIHPNKPGRYRFFYDVSLTATHTNFTMMTEFRLTDNQQELEQAIKMKIPEEPAGYGVRYIPVQEDPLEDNYIYQVVEEMPEFPGGLPAAVEYLRTNIRYPKTALQDSVQGRVIVQVVILEDGSPAQAQLIRSVDPRLDREALRVVQSMPKWIPGKQQGRVVKVRYTLPVVFKLPQ